MTDSLQNFHYWPESPEQYYKIIERLIEEKEREKMMKTHFYSSIPYFSLKEKVNSG